MTRSVLALFAAAWLTVPVAAQTSFPMITHCTPVAVQRGTTTEITVSGQKNFAKAYKVLIEGTGVTAEVVQPKLDPKKPVDPKAEVRSVDLKVAVAADAPLGVREFRIATELGISSLGQLLIVADPVVVEASGTSTPTKAQRVPVPSVICGRIEAAENVDHYRISAKAGQTLTLEVVCARIQDKIHDLQKHADPLVAVFDSTGRELAAGDDGYFADPAFSYKIPTDGEYVIQVRDAKYDGDPRWAYALHVTDKPYAAQTFPMAANPGQTVTVEPVGSARLAVPTATLRAPATPGVSLVSLTANGAATNPVPVVVTEVPIVTEVEPNDTAKQATRVPLPGGANGRFHARRDLDYYVFKGEKGKPVRLEIFARRFATGLRSRTDAVLEIMAPDGKILASNDDANGKDPLLTYTPPADGDVLVRVRDLHSKGGEGYVYFLEIDRARPDFEIKADPSKAMIGPGSRTAWYVSVSRSNGFAGPVKVEVHGLPKGVSASPLTIPANMTVGCLVVSAAADAKPDAGIVRVVGSAEAKDEHGKAVTLTRIATPVEEIYMPGGGRGRFDAAMQAVAVTGPSDLVEIQVKPTRIVLKPGQEVKIDVTVKRGSDYDKGVTLDVLFRHLGQKFADPLPPGVTLVEGKSKTLLGNGSAGHIVLKAAPNAAECTDVPVCVQGFVSVNFVVKIGYASEVILVSVKK